MKLMLLFLTLIFGLPGGRALTLSSPASQPVLALIAPSAGYVRILEDGVAFYRNPSGQEEDLLFTLFKSYYLRVSESENEDYYLVELGSGILGFVKKSAVTPVDILPDPVYPELYADSDYTLVLRTKPAADAPAEGYALSGQQLLLYGLLTAEDGTQYAYVDLMGEKFGYVPVEKLNLPEIPLHPDPLPQPPEEELPDSSEPEGGSGTLNEDPPTIDGTMQLVLVLSILIPSVVVVILMFRPSKKVPKNYSKYY